MEYDNQRYIQECITFIHLLQKEMDIEDAVTQFQGLIQREMYPKPHLLYVKEILQLTEIQYFLMLYAYLYEIDPMISQYVRERTKADYLPLGIILSLYSKIESLPLSSFSTCLDVLNEGIVFCHSEQTYLLMKEIRLHSFICYYLHSGCMPVNSFLLLCDPQQSRYIPVHAETKKRLLYYLKNHISCCICGENHSGRKTVVMQCCQVLQLFVYRISMQIWNRLDEGKQEQILSAAVFFNFLQKGWLWIEDVDEEHVAQIAYIKKRIEPLGLRFIVITTMENVEPYPSVNLPAFLDEQDMKLMSAALWEFEWPFPQLHLTPYELLNLKEEDPNGTNIAVYIQNKEIDKKSSFYQILSSTYCISEWIGDQNLKSQLLDLIFYIQNKSRVAAYMHREGKSCSILFHGPSGTGKTMAAKILGNETHLPVWQINLSVILDKYIGESEKHLEKLFQEAQKHNCILLFDEADVLFSKRTSITSSNDRYANSSTAYLLQKLESYTGVIVMTSNLLTNFDDAFLRRIRFIIRFPLPDKQMKLRKWLQCFQNIPLAEELLYEEYAQNFNLSLAQIDNVYENAVSYWIQEGSPALKRHHLYKALKQEYQKKMEALPEYIIRMGQNHEGKRKDETIRQTT